MEPNQNPEHAPFWMWMVLLAVILIGVGFFAWINSNQSKTETVAPVADTSTPATAVTTPSTTPDTVSTADWKTYTDIKYGFSVKYPSDWVVKTGKDASDYGNNAISLTSPEIAQKLSAIKVGEINTSIFADVAIVYFSSITDTYGGLGGSQPKTLEELSAKLESPSSIIIDGEQGYAGIKLGDASAYQILIEKNNHIYQISFIGTGHSSKNDLSSIENTILSTFQFIK